MVNNPLVEVRMASLSVIVLKIVKVWNFKCWWLMDLPDFKSATILLLDCSWILYVWLSYHVHIEARQQSTLHVYRYISSWAEWIYGSMRHLLSCTRMNNDPRIFSTMILHKLVHFLLQDRMKKSQHREKLSLWYTEGVILTRRGAWARENSGKKVKIPQFREKSKKIPITCNRSCVLALHPLKCTAKYPPFSFVFIFCSLLIRTHTDDIISI